MESPPGPGADTPIWCVVVAAGSGRRFGGAKQFAPLGRSSVLELSVQVSASVCDGVVVVAPADSVDRVRATLPLAGAVVAGGESRSESSRLGVAAVPDEAAVILVHDAARPLATPELFTRVVDEVLGGSDAVVPVVPVTDTVRDRDGVLVDRDRLVAVQTPQGFPARLLREAVRSGHEGTDDAAVVAAHGARVTFVEGESRNRKITTADDLLVAEALLGESGVPG